MCSGLFNRFVHIVYPSITIRLFSLALSSSQFSHNKYLITLLKYCFKIHLQNQSKGIFIYFHFESETYFIEIINLNEQKRNWRIFNKGSGSKRAINDNIRQNKKQNVNRIWYKEGLPTLQWLTMIRGIVLPKCTKTSSGKLSAKDVSITKSSLYRIVHGMDLLPFHMGLPSFIHHLDSPGDFVNNTAVTAYQQSFFPLALPDITGRTAKCCKRQTSGHNKRYIQLRPRAGEVSNTSRILKLVRYYAVIIARCGKLCMQTRWKSVLAALTKTSKF